MPRQLAGFSALGCSATRDGLPPMFRCKYTCRMQPRRTSWHAALRSPITLFAGFPEPQRQAGEVAVRRQEAEPVHLAGIQDVHCVDDQRGIRTTLAGSMPELLDGLDGAFAERVDPSFEMRRGPVSIGPPQRGGSMAGELFQSYPSAKRPGCFRHRSGRPISNALRLSHGNPPEKVRWLIVRQTLRSGKYPSIFRTKPHKVERPEPACA